MRYTLISIDEFGTPDDDVIITLWCKPSLLESIMGLHPECLAFVGRENLWQTLDGETASFTESRVLQKMSIQDDPSIPFNPNAKTFYSPSQKPPSRTFSKSRSLAN
tara:strand:- start:244 stop:561 length:318 start_codon:yes stop_codon:yes gene_type:complete